MFAAVSAWAVLCLIKALTRQTVKVIWLGGKRIGLSVYEPFLFISSLCSSQFTGESRSANR